MYMPQDNRLEKVSACEKRSEVIRQYETVSMF